MRIPIGKGDYDPSEGGFSGTSITPFATTETYPQSFANATELPERKARIVDISRYWRTGGIDWPRLKENFDAVIIAAGVAFNGDVLLPEHTEKADEHDVSYATYHIPDPAKNMAEQAHFYAELPGVKTHRAFADWEAPYSGGKEPTAAQMLSYLMALDNSAEQTAGIYSRMEILKRMGLPVWLHDRDLWLAQYIYEFYVDAMQYRRFEPFLERFGMRVPPSVDGTGLEENVVLWQFTEYGDARFYCANRLTEDPKYVYGMTNADLNVSMMGYDAFMKWFNIGGVVEPPPTPQPCGCCDVLSQIATIVEKWRLTK